MAQIDGTEVRRGFGEFDLSELADDEFVTASGLDDGGYIVWKKTARRAVGERTREDRNG